MPCDPGSTDPEILDQLVVFDDLDEQLDTANPNGYRT